MTNQIRAGFSGWVFGGLCLLVAVAMSVTGAARRPVSPRADTGRVAAAPAAPESALAIARADSDTLDLQLD